MNIFISLQQWMVRKFQCFWHITNVCSVLWGLSWYDALCEQWGWTEMLDEWALNLWRWLWDSLLDYLTKLLTCLSSDGYLLMNRWWEETSTIMVYWAPAGCLYCCNNQCVWTTVCWFGRSKVTFLTMRTNTLETYCTFSLLTSIRSIDWHSSHIRLLNIKLEQRDS